MKSNQVWTMESNGQTKVKSELKENQLCDCHQSYEKRREGSKEREDIIILI